MKKFIVFLLLGVMFVFNTVAYAQAENTAQDKIGGADIWWLHLRPYGVFRGIS